MTPCYFIIMPKQSTLSVVIFSYMIFFCYIPTVIRQDSQNGLSPLSGGVRQPDYGRVQPEADGGWENILREAERERVAYGECGTEIAAGSMSSHMMTRHGKAATRRHLWAPRRMGSPGCTKRVFPRRTAGDSARWRDARGCQRHEWRCRCTSCTGTSTTPWLYWRRATSPYHGAPGATSESQGGR